MQAAIQLGQDFLRKSQAAEPGWGYFARSEQAFPEPTCYSLLALADTNFDPVPSIDWLSSLVNSEGQLFLPNDDLPNWSTAHLIITLSRLGLRSDIIHRSVAWLLDWESKFAEDSEIIPLDASLIGWSWISDTFSWVQPTSYAVLALKLTGNKTHARVKEAETLLFDRTCDQGGWNFGNRQVFDHRISPTVFDTAVALLALQDLPDDTGAIEQSLTYLEQAALRLPSALSLAMTILCLNVYGRSIENYIDALVDRQAVDGSWRQMVWWTALAVLALQAADGGENVFQL